jgi:hypothetical protein
MKSSVVILGCLLLSSLAYAGKESSGGGDLCEDRIKIIRDDLVSWIHQSGPQGLALPSGTNATQYSNQMLSQLGTAKISCVGASDKGFPVQVNGHPKVCRFDQDFGESRITCDLTKFMSLSEANQYVLVHHEFAGLAGFELPNGDDSNYEISNQISEYISNQSVKKLAIKRSPVVRTSVSGHKFIQVTDHPELGEAWRDESGLIWGDPVVDKSLIRFRATDVTSYFAKVSQQKAAAYCNAIGAHLPTKAEFHRLATYLGRDSETGFTPEIIPYIGDVAYWWTGSTAENANYEERKGYMFRSYYGNFEADPVRLEEHFRCVTR